MCIKVGSKKNPIKLYVYYSCQYFKGTEISIALTTLTHFVWCLYWTATHQKDYSLHNAQQKMDSRSMDEKMWRCVYVNTSHISKKNVKGTQKITRKHLKYIRQR